MQGMSILFNALLASTLAALASPVPNTTALEKRITHVGRGTWYEPGLGACGFTDSASDPVLAIGQGRYGDGGNCNQWVAITNTANGATAFGLTRDECESCSTEDLDMSPSLFQQLGNLDQGVITVSWHFQAKGWQP